MAATAGHTGRPPDTRPARRRTAGSSPRTPVKVARIERPWVGSRAHRGRRPLDAGVDQRDEAVRRDHDDGVALPDVDVLNLEIAMRRTLYLTPNGAMSPVQAGIELALPQTNTAGALFRVETSALNPENISMIRRVTGNVFGRGGGGIEILYNGRVPMSAVTRVR